MSRARKMFMAAGALAALAGILILTGIVIVSSGWFREKVRERLVSAVEEATGGRAEIGAFRFDWRQMRAQVDGFVLHGREPAAGPPLARADTLAVGIKIVSVLKRSVDLQYLDVRRPQLYLIIYPDGGTNIPSPRASRPGPDAIETILDLGIGRFGLQNGSFEVAGQGSTPFDAQGRNLRAQFSYDAKGPRYNGRLAFSPGTVHWGNARPVPVNLALALAIEKNRINISRGEVSTAQSRAEFSGAVEDVAAFSGAIQYTLHGSLGEIVQSFDLRTQLEGPVTLTGRASFHGLADFRSEGQLHASGVLFRPDPHFILRNYQADAGFLADAQHAALRGMRFTATVLATLSGKDRALEEIPIQGRIESAVLRHRDLEVSGLNFNALQGSFRGNGEIAGLKRVRLEGDVTGFDVRQSLRLYSPQSVPWDAAASGPIRLTATLGQSDSVVVSGRMAISPAATGAPVNGEIDLTYDAAADTLDLAQSNLALPATRAQFSGILGRALKVHATTRNWNEILPAFDIQSLPVALRNGEALFDGSVTGKLDNPRIQGHVAATQVLYAGRLFDAVAGDVDLSGAGLTLRNASLQHGALRLKGGGALAMQRWQVDDGSAIAAVGSLRNAPAADLLTLAGSPELQLTGTVSAEGRISGTVGDPRLDAQVNATHGTFADEPFDRFTGTLHYAANQLELTHGQLAAGVRQVAVDAYYRHQPGDLGKGQLHFQVDSNAMPLAQFAIMRKAYPGIAGTVELHSAGAIEVAPGSPGFRVADLNGALHGRGLRINDAPLRDLEVSAATNNGELSAHFDSEVAGSEIQGEGKWRLAGDYPGSVRVSFKGIDLERLRVWLRGAKPPGGAQITGSAEGTLALAGPAIHPDEWKGRLELPTLTIGPAGQLADNGKSLALHNAAPIVVVMERGIVKVESARMVGRATDLSLAGTLDLRQNSPLDLRLNGRFDLATLEDFNSDISGAGYVETGVTIRGALAQPQIAGRLDIKDGTFNLTDAPVSISKAHGVILFDGTRATIQSFTGESGGGRISLSGFAGYDSEALIFRIHASAHEVRLRYPEDFSTVANASLNLTGGTDSSTLSGRITILRTGFNPHSDFSSVLAKSAEPVRTPSAQTGLLANLHFDVQVDTAPDITFETSLAQGLQAEGNLRLRGTATNPSLLGRINITQGQIVFFGTTFTVEQGSIAFYNPVKIDPLINVDLDTKARGIDVILNVSGPINKLNLTPRSDPPMPFSDIVALLATGRSPTSDYATLMSSPASTQSLQQMGASALLGQAIASPVTGRLQRFFGVTRLKIDPTLESVTGVAYNPQARLTVEQQVTPEITFTYITDVTSTNPLVVQVEWAMNRNWSAVALRDENGLVGLNFVYKRRFK